MKKKSKNRKVEKKSNFEKKIWKKNKKKEKVRKKREKLAKKNEEESLWIIVVIHSEMCVEYVLIP